MRGIILILQEPLFCPTPTPIPSRPVNRVKRLHERGAYDRATVHAILDAAALCHVAYVVDGQPYCTPTLFWREGDHLYWHGSSASRMLRSQSEGEPVCVTVSHLDSLVLARSGFNHSVDYRSVMAFGHARIVDDPDEKIRALRAMIDRFYPGRWATLRPATLQEIKATRVIGMTIEQASAKVRAKGIGDDEDGLRPADLRRAHPGEDRARRARTVSATPSRRRAARGAGRVSRGPRARRRADRRACRDLSACDPMSRGPAATRLATCGSLAPGKVNHGELAGRDGSWTAGAVKESPSPPAGART